MDCATIAEILPHLESLILGGNDNITTVRSMHDTRCLTWHLTRACDWLVGRFRQASKRWVSACMTSSCSTSSSHRCAYASPISSADSVSGSVSVTVVRPVSVWSGTRPCDVVAVAKFRSLEMLFVGNRHETEKPFSNISSVKLGDDAEK